LILRSAFAFALAAAAGAAAAAPVFSGYQDIAQGFDAGGYRIRLDHAPRPPVLTLAFASGECGQEHWAGRDAQKLAAVNLPRLRAVGRRYIVSTGGEAGVFTCASAAGMAAFIGRYRGPGLVGFDFDIEGRQTPQQIDDLVRHAAAAQKRWPALAFSFTIATHAGTQGLNATGEQVMQALKRHRFERAVVNLMTMNYGPADARFCVLRDGGGCDMGASGLQAARNLHRRHGVPFARIALTPMLGINDVTENRFTLDDARRLAADVARQGLQGLHFWSIDRDRPCDGGATVVSPLCHGLDAPAGAYTRAFADGLNAR
jgi:chitinase